MRRNNVRILSTILAGTFMCITLLACKNFLNANNVSDEIKDAIAYNNAKSVNLAIECKQEMGSIFPSPSYTAKVGYDFEIQLLLNEDYYVVKDPSTMLEAVSRIDETVSRSENVEFQVEKQNLEDKRTGLYRIKTKIIKYADDILIRPSCYELPILTDHTPDSLTRTAFSNESIVLTFNIPMEEPETDATTTAAVFNYNNILITYNGDSVSDLFESPVFNAEKTKLSITPKPIALQKYINDRKLPVILFDVYVSQDIKATIDGVSIPLLLNNHNSFSVSYKADFETTPPAKRELFITNTPIEIETAGAVKDNEKFSEVALAEKGNYTDEQYTTLVQKNTTTKEFYIYGKFFDADSGVKSVNVFYEKSYTKDRNTGDDIVVELTPSEIEACTKSYTEDSPEVEFITQGTETIFCIKHTLEGAGEYSITVSDICGNESGKATFSVFRADFSNIKAGDNGSYITDGVKTNYLYQPCKQEEPKNWSTFNETEFNQELKHLTYAVKKLKLWKSVEYPLEKLSVLCEYNGKTQAFTPTINENTVKWDITLDVDSVSGLPITLILRDSYGNETKDNYNFPNKNENFFVTHEEMDTPADGILHFYKFYGQSLGRTGFHYMIRTNNSTGAKEYKYDAKDALDDNYTYSIIYGRLLGEMPKDFSFNSTSYSNDAVEPISISNEQFTFSESETKGLVKATVTFTQEQLNYYDIIFIDTNSNPFNSVVPKNTGIYTVELEPKFIYGKKDKYLYVNAIKNGKQANDDNFQIRVPSITNTHPLFAQLDVVPPEIDSTIKYSEEYVTFTLQDYESGPKSGTIYLNNNPDKPYVFESKDDKYLCKIPFCEIYPYSTYEQEISYSLEDIAGNKTTGTKKLYSSPLSYKEYYEFLKRDGNYIYLKEYRHNTNYSTFYVVPFSNGFATTYNNYCSATFSKIDNDTRTAKIYTFSIPGNSTTGTFVKIVNNEEGHGHPFYYFNYYDEDNDSYTLGTGQYNGIYKIGNSKSAIGVCSDAPVYVHTLVTKVPYEICKDWDHLEWEYNKKSLNEKVLDFTTPVQQRYTIPVGSMDSGDCYVVIAHYANNTIDVSEVMQN